MTTGECSKPKANSKPKAKAVKPAAVRRDRSVRTHYLKATFDGTRKAWGHMDFVPVADMNDPTKGLVSLDDTVTITAEVKVLASNMEASCAKAAGDGNLPALQWLREIGTAWDQKTCAAAARGGHLEVLIWARLNGCPWDETTCAEAAKGGHFSVLTFYAEECERAKRKREDDRG